MQTRIQCLVEVDGPIVVQINTLLKYLPFTPEGRFCSIDWYEGSSLSSLFSTKSCMI